MEIIESDVVGTKYTRTEESGLCPVCEAVMTRMHKLEEGDHIFI